MFNDALKVIRRVAFAVGILLSLLVLLELARGFALFYRISPTLGWAFLAGLMLLLIGLAVYVGRVWFSYPKALPTSALPPAEEATHRDLRHHCKYLVRYLGRLEQNTNLDAARRETARLQVEQINEVLSAHPLNDDLRRTIEQTEGDVIGPLLDDLAADAHKEIRRSVRDVMLGVTLSPYHSIDLVIVLYRNCAMVLRTVAIYSNRPNGREQLMVLKDVMRVVVTLNFLYVGRNLLENLFSHVPFLGRVVDDIGQGLGAGLFTSAAGHAAIQRCAAYHGWKSSEATDSLALQTRAFLADVRDIFTQDVLPDLRKRITAEVPQDEISKAGFWDSVAQGINASVDATASVVDTLLVRPAVAGTRTVAKAGSAVTRGVARAGSSVASLVTPGGDKKSE